MPNAFSLAHSRCTQVSDPALREEILAHTGSDAATSAILRSIERFAGDASIQRFEMTPKPHGRNHRSPMPVAWSVHAVRPEASPRAE